MSTPLGSIRNWSNVQLMEDVNDKDSVSAVKYNEHRRQVKVRKKEVEWRVCEEVEWRVCEEVECRACEEAEHCQAEEQRRLEVERHMAKEQAKRCVSHFLVCYDRADSIRWRRSLCNSMARARARRQSCQYATSAQNVGSSANSGLVSRPHVLSVVRQRPSVSGPAKRS